MKKLKYSHDAIDQIYQLRKDTTVRFNDDKRIKDGDNLSLCDPDGISFGHATVMRAETVKVDTALNKIDNLGGRYPILTKHRLLDVLNQHYKADITYDTRVKVIWTPNIYFKLSYWEEVK